MTNEQNYPIEGTFSFVKQEDGKLKFNVTLQGETNENGGIISDKLKELIDLGNATEKPLGLRAEMLKLMKSVFKNSFMKMFLLSLVDSIDEHKRKIEGDEKEIKPPTRSIWKITLKEIAGMTIFFLFSGFLIGSFVNTSEKFDLPIQFYAILMMMCIYTASLLIRLIFTLDKNSNA